MPKIVDHEQRHSELAAAVWRVIARQGVEAATVREVARESRWSPGTLAHYFRNKNDLLFFAWRLATEGETADQRNAARSRDGFDALEAAMAASLVLDEESRVRSRVLLSFYTRVFANPEFSEGYRSCEAKWRNSIADLISRAKELGETRPDLDVETEAHLLAAFVTGLTVQAALESEAYPPQRQRQLLRDYLRRLLPASP